MKLYQWIFANLLSSVVSCVSAFILFQVKGQTWLAGVEAIFLFILLHILSGKFLYDQIAQFLDIIEVAILHLKDGEFSLRLPETKNSRLQLLTDSFHDVAKSLQLERSNLYQRELLLDRVFETVSSALLLTDGRNRIMLCNPAAQHLLGRDKAIKGMLLNDLLESLPTVMAESIKNKDDVLFTFDGKDGEPETWQLSCEHFRLQGQEHCLYHFKQMTRALSRAEVDTWKKVIRVLSHELNNSLAPITSLSHSGKQILAKPLLAAEEITLLHQIFTTLAERASHLNEFLSAYAQFARMPKSKKDFIEWRSFLIGLQRLVPFQWDDALPLRFGLVDTCQLSQVLINLIKNAQEAGAPQDTIRVQIIALGDWDKIIVSDGGCGMPEEQLNLALLPFYSTKRDGTGLGLALCREIIESHHGRIKLANKKEGGLEVSIWLPSKELGH